jgi:hypothetical protein
VQQCHRCFACGVERSRTEAVCPVCHPPVSSRSSRGHGQGGSRP